MTQELLLGVTSQTLVLESARPLSAVASVQLFEAEQDDTGQAETAVSGAGTVDSFSTTTSAAVTRTNPRLLALTSSSGAVVGRRIFVTNDGLGEVVEIARIDGNNVYARHPLLNDYASGATVKGNLRATIAVDNAWAAEVGNLSSNAYPTARYRARWEVTFAADMEGSATETGVLWTDVDLVRYSSTPQVSPLDIENAYPGWLDRIGHDDRTTQGRYLIAEAIDLLRDQLTGRGTSMRSIRSTAALRRLAIARVVWLAAEANAIIGSERADAVEAAQRSYERQFAALVESPVLPQDKTGGGGIDTRIGQAQRRFIR